VEENFTGGGGQKKAFGWVRDVYRGGKTIYRGGIAPPCPPGGYATNFQEDQVRRVHNTPD
jgi:hypothetical protein